MNHCMFCEREVYRDGLCEFHYFAAQQAEARQREWEAQTQQEDSDDKEG
jgi:hypothetical protein